MPKSPESLYQQRKANLQSREDVYLAGETGSAATARLFIAPKPEIGFDASKLYEFQQTLKIAGEWVSFIRPDWHRLILVDGSYLPKFNFGLLVYFSRISELYIHIYPSPLYADQIYAYKRGLLSGSKNNPLMDWLSHDVTEEQIDAISKVGNDLDLTKLPPVPELFEFLPYKKGRRIG